MKSFIFLSLILFFFIFIFFIFFKISQNNSVFLAPDNPNPNSNYLLLVSAQCSYYQDWQSIGVWWSAKKNWPTANYIRLLSCSPFNNFFYRYHTIVPSFQSSDWSTHPLSGDHYPPYNRPISIKEYLDKIDPKEDYLVIIDPDVIIRKSMQNIPVKKGTPIGQKYEYLEDKNALEKLAKIFGIKGKLQPIGMPIIIHKLDLKLLANKWLDLTEKIRDNEKSRKIAGWVAEMHSYCLAAAELGLIHDIRDDLADRVPYNRIADPYVLHYDLKHEYGDFSWDKRDYFNKDILRKKEKLPVPKKVPTSRFLEVFETINEGLEQLYFSII